MQGEPIRAAPPMAAARLLVVAEARPAQQAAAPQAAQRRAAAQVLAGAAQRAASGQSRLAGAMLVTLAATELGLQAFGASPQPGWPWTAATLALGCSLMLAQLRALRRAPALPLPAWVALVVALAVWPVWAGHAEAALGWLALCAALGATLAAALAPHAAAAAVAAACAVAAGAALGGTGLLLGAVASGAALALATRLRQRWQRQTQHALDQTERLRQLQGQLDAAQRNDNDKSRFLAIASHDLRQPVHALGLFAATLHKRLHDSPDEALARNLLRSVDALERSFNAMLDISRLDGGAVAPRAQTFPLRDVFRRLHMQYGGQAELAGLALRFSPGGKYVTSDPQLLERVLGNLVQNAIRYTTRGGVVVVARNTATHLNVEVWDTGCGIAPQDLARIFEEFYQVGRGERDRSQGLCMGLAIVKRLAVLLGHRLEVASTLGRGTLFRLGVPLGTLAGLDDETAAADTQPMALDPGEARMILVVDDEEPIREGLRLLLQEWGYQAMTAADAAQAESAVAALEGRVDLILSDLHLGRGPGGQEVVAQVRRLCGREVPAILVTGDTAGQALRDVAAGADPVLFKPVQPRHLLEALRNALEGPVPRD